MGEIYKLVFMQNLRVLLFSFSFMRLDLYLLKKFTSIHSHIGKASKLRAVTLYICIIDSYSLALGNLKAFSWK